LATLSFHHEKKVYRGNYILGKEFTTSEWRIWSNQMHYFGDAQLMDARVKQVQWGNFFNGMHEPNMQRSVRICNVCNAVDPLADHRTVLSIMQKDLQTTWPIHNRRVNLLCEEQKEEQAFDMWQVSLYTLSKDANVEGLTGRNCLLFLLIQNCRDSALKKNILDHDKNENEITRENVLAVERKQEKG
jgi:hypothetical protein